MMYKRQPGTSDTPQMLSLKDLKDRGWTEALVKQFLGVPDALKPNPYYHWENAWRHGAIWEPATEQSDPAFLERITVNYIRHQLTSYDTHLEQAAGQIGVHQAGKVIRRRIYDAIARGEYP